MLTVFREAVAQAGGVRAFARQSEVHPSLVGAALQDGGKVGPKLLAAAGLTRIITYARVTP